MADSAVFEIGGVIRRYDWGSRTTIQHLVGSAPDGRPAAELWFGTHRGDPSPALGTTLDRLAPDLPFLLKVLAADKALSIQVHPSRAQARAGFAAEDRAGIARDARERNYVDENHKPELLCALSDFEALCGFRAVDLTLAVLAEIPELDFIAGLLHGPDGLRAAFTTLLTHPRPAELAAAVAARATAHGPLRPAWLVAQDFPGDIGVVLSVLLNHVRLAPGEAIYLGAGQLHAYLRGTGVEVMANSDNVLRCGLTSKHVDVPELMKVTEFDTLDEPRWARTGDAFVVPVPDFALRTGTLDAVTGPAIVLCTDGRVGVDAVTLGPGHAAFVRAGHHATVATAGTVFAAVPGPSSGAG